MRLAITHKTVLHTLHDKRCMTHRILLKRHVWTYVTDLSNVCINISEILFIFVDSLFLEHIRRILVHIF